MSRAVEHTIQLLAIKCTVQTAALTQSHKYSNNRNSIPKWVNDCKRATAVISYIQRWMSQFYLKRNRIQCYCRTDRKTKTGKIPTHITCMHTCINIWHFCFEETAKTPKTDRRFNSIFSNRWWNFRFCKIKTHCWMRRTLCREYWIIKKPEVPADILLWSIILLLAVWLTQTRVIIRSFHRMWRIKMLPP